MNLKNVFCAALGTLISLLCALDRFMPVMIWVITFATLDFITGLIKAKLHHDICSRRAFEGLWKKLALISALFLGILLDFALPSLVGAGEYAVMSGGVVFSSFIGFYIVVGEAISIVENLYECSVPLPAFVIKFLRVCKEKIEKEGGEEE
ncbi:MAG: phage holin family protein [Ruminococcaceae bacterium]|nr:phage holin family protein [Oscillospiraceae bacterium]